MCVFLITRMLWEGGAFVNRFNHTNWVTVVTPTDRPKSVRNRGVIEVFDDFFVLSHCFLLLFFCGWRGFCHRTESDLLLLSSTGQKPVDLMRYNFVRRPAVRLSVNNILLLYLLRN